MRSEKSVKSMLAKFMDSFQNSKPTNRSKKKDIDNELLALAE